MDSPINGESAPTSNVIIDTGDPELKPNSVNEVNITRPGETDIVIDTGEDNFDASVLPTPQTTAFPSSSSSSSDPNPTSISKHSPSPDSEKKSRTKTPPPSPKSKRTEKKRIEDEEEVEEEEEVKRMSKKRVDKKKKEAATPRKKAMPESAEEGDKEPADVREYMEANRKLADEFYQTVPGASGMPSTSTAYKSATQILDVESDGEDSIHDRSNGESTDDEEKYGDGKRRSKKSGRREKNPPRGKSDEDEDEEQEDEGEESDVGDKEKKNKKKDDQDDMEEYDGSSSTDSDDIESGGRKQAGKDEEEGDDGGRQYANKKFSKADEYIEKMRLIEEIKQLSRAGAVPPQQPTMHMPVDMLRKIKEYQESMIDEIMGIGFLGIAWSSFIGLVEKLNERFDPFAKVFGMGLKLRGAKKAVDDNIHMYEGVFKHIYKKLGIGGKEVSPWLQLVLVTVQIFGQVHVQNMEREMTEQAEAMAADPRTRLYADQVREMYENQRREQQEQQKRAWGKSASSSAESPTTATDKPEVHAAATKQQQQQQPENGPVSANKSDKGDRKKENGDATQVTMKPVSETVPEQPSVVIDMVQPEEKIVVKPHSDDDDDDSTGDDNDDDDDDDDDVIVQIPKKPISTGRSKKK